MKNSDKGFAFMQYHIAVFLWGFTAILGKLISLPEIELVWYRILFTLVFLFLFPTIISQLRQLTFKNIITLLAIGVLVGLHWIFFYGSIKRSNSSIALCCLATISIFTAFLEPLFNRKKIGKNQLIFGFVSFVGILCILKANLAYAEGIIWGLIAAFLSAVFSVFNKKIIVSKGAYAVTFIELFGGLMVLTLCLNVFSNSDIATMEISNSRDVIYLLTLSSLCTALPFVLSLNALRHISAFAANLTLNLEPVYGILMAMVFFDEFKELNLLFFIGTTITLGSVLIYNYLELNTQKNA